MAIGIPPLKQLRRQAGEAIAVIPPFGSDHLRIADAIIQVQRPVLCPGDLPKGNLNFRERICCRQREIQIAALEQPPA
ncbi:MAG: hypothetical protein HYX84_08295 [Chloroflexi bacterium]|nr:hypothetical protein [Chloroflexota bacterium]